ncbi:MAG: N-acetylglucosamine-6-phosphate deacetylase, partial [Erysipelotrichaceae bacterium]|nr:N-acetylglucosamine-6-phosphate deacetylase [Erysipelotrichaceae bacterium]
LKCMGPDRIAIITDMTLGGIPDGDYDNGTYQIQVRDNVARFRGIDPDADHALAGSTRPMLSGIRTVCELGIPLYDAVRMASLTPARIVYMDECCGSLEVGKAADITVFTKDYKTLMTMIQGQVVYRRKV